MSREHAATRDARDGLSGPLAVSGYGQVLFALAQPHDDAPRARSRPGQRPSPFSGRRSLQRVLDDAFSRSYASSFEGWLGGLLGRFRRGGP